LYPDRLLPRNPFRIRYRINHAISPATSMLSESSNPMTSPSVDQQVSEASNGLAKLKVANAVVPRSLFSADLISPEVQALLPAHYIIRPLSEDDFAKGFFDCLAQLT
ncbi:hypothetical protein IWQ60_012512, partial [Tieghemiomyces parasiticus]